MTGLPAPLAPPYCDLRGYEFMPIFGQRLFGSRFYSLALQNPRAGLAAQKLWWEAWQQCPAGSLPSDDFSLCRMADFGADLRAWAKAKAVALYGFVLCDDGRLYHPVLCVEAISAYERRLRDRTRKAKWRASRDEDGGDRPTDVPRDTTETEHGRDTGGDVDGDGSVRADRDRDRDSKKDPPLSVPPCAIAPPQAASPPARSRVRRTILPEEWRPSPEQRSYAARLGIDPDATALNFRDYWVGHGKPMASWPATWQRWCRVDAERRKPQDRPASNGAIELILQARRSGAVFSPALEEPDGPTLLPH